ncbi:hypothetical protein Q5530_16205 [Saccharothrix sp. BKS2]|uniref:hypothetical protein n=1 Tax=Saccharothrix sp. BKS2 TaxID=3064400 RepID=UPI0039E9E370
MTGGAPGTTGLERRYRRLLAWYPRDHRERNGEEMLAVLLAGAGGRTRPGPRESADLLRGAARLHLRRVVAADGGVEPGGVLAVVSLLGPVALPAGATGSRPSWRSAPPRWSPARSRPAVPAPASAAAPRWSCCCPW